LTHVLLRIVCLCFPLAAQFQGSAPSGQASPSALSLSLDDAIQRGLKTNLGLLTRENSSTTARAARLRSLSALLPYVSGGLTASEQQINLATFGFRFSGVPQVIGPFGYQDARATSSVTLFDQTLRKNFQSSNESMRAAELSVRDARDLVVQAVAAAYLQIIATGARVDATTVQVATAQALYEKARDQHTAGLLPAIDELRAQVEWKTQQQQLLALENQLSKDKLSLARAIGLPSGQSFDISDQAPFAPLDGLMPEETLRRAFESRADYQSAQAQVHAAELSRQAAAGNWYPTLSAKADYGDIGSTLAQSHGTFTVSGSVKFTIFDGGRNRSDIQQADATLKQRREELANLQGQIDQEVRTALFDLKSAADQVEVARSNVDLANQTLVQARDRFSAGVTDNIEVVQAQESVANAHQNLISSVYAHNLAKVALARAVGSAETSLKQFMGGK
jgi:outer membrane protein TolC